jgi:hypothetical protein
VTPNAADSWRPGLEIEGHVLLEPLGQGGMGAVWRVQHVATGARRALKVLRGATRPEDLLRFRREVEALGRLDGHPNVVRVHTAGVHAGSPWVVTELVDGGDLATHLKAGPMDPRAAAALVRDVARGVAHAHARGVLHRDIKPANVLLEATGAPRLADFGLARLQGAESLTQSGTLVGTPAYMAPEQARGERADERADVWGLGATLYHALSGQAPGTGTTPLHVLTSLAEGRVAPLLALRPDVPPHLAAVCQRALAFAPGDRWPDAASLAAALERWLAGERPEPTRTSRYALGTLGALSAFAALGALGVASRQGRLEPAAPAAVVSSLVVADGRATRPPSPQEPATVPAPDWPARMAEQVKRVQTRDQDVGPRLKLNAVTSQVAAGHQVTEEEEAFLEEMAREGVAEAQTGLARVLRRRSRDPRRVADLLWQATRNPEPDCFAAVDACTLLYQGTPSLEDEERARWLLAEASARARDQERTDLAASVAHTSAAWGRTVGDFGRAVRLLAWRPEVALDLERRHRVHPEDPALWALLGISAYEGWGYPADRPAARRLLLRALAFSPGPPRDLARLWLERHGDDPEWRSAFLPMDVPETPRGRSLLDERTEADAHFDTVQRP